MDLGRTLRLSYYDVNQRERESKAERAPEVEVQPRRGKAASNTSTVQTMMQEYLQRLKRESAPPSEEPSPDQEENAPSPAKARLERRGDVAGRDRLNYRLNFTEQRRLERDVEKVREDAFEQSMTGRLYHSPLTRWCFNQRTRRLEKLIIVGLLVGVVGLLLAVTFTQREVAEAAEPVQEETPIENLGVALLEGREASEDCIRRFFEAESMEEVLPLIRHPEVLKPVMERWYARHEHRQEADIVFETVKIKELEGARFYLHFVRLQDDVDPRPIAVEDTADGFKVDWETAVGYQAMDWKRFMNERPTETVYMRVVARADDYYNFEFHDSAVWACYRLSHPDEETSLYGYVKRFSERERQLQDAIGQDPSGSDYFVLGLRFPEGAGSDHAVEIVEIQRSKWVETYELGQTHFDL